MSESPGGTKGPVRLLIIGAEQFGYLTDTFRYARDLGPGYRVTYLCWDYGLERQDPGPARVVYVPRAGARPVRLARLLRAAHRELRSGRHDLAFVVHLPGCSLLRLANPGVPMVLDIRTAYIRRSPLAQRTANLMLRAESTLFRRRTVVSEGTARSLGLDPRTTRVVPVGGGVFSERKRTYDALRLLYVGTLDHRDIPATVRAAGRVARETGKSVTYDIAGYGSPEEESRLHRTIAGENMGGAVIFHGRVAQDRLAPLFERATAGVVYVPRRPEFEDQPPTKLFEYLLSGLPVIATNTRACRAVVTGQNGVLVEATGDAFAEGLTRLLGRLADFDETHIRASADAWRWERVVREKLEPALREALADARGAQGGGDA